MYVLFQRPAPQPAATAQNSAKGSSARIYVSEIILKTKNKLTQHRNDNDNNNDNINNNDICRSALRVVCLCPGKVLGNLQLNLLSKSKVYEDSALSAIFLHNNYNYILKSLEKYKPSLCCLLLLIYSPRVLQC